MVQLGGKCMEEDKRDAISILADMRRKKEGSKSANKMATMFLAFAYLVGFFLLIYMGAGEILAYISIFVFLLFALVYHDYRESQRDIESIDSLYLSYEFIKNQKK